MWRIRLDAVDDAARACAGGGGVYKISYNIIISYRYLEIKLL